MESLDQIARRHGTDKASEAHGFTAIYERFFGPLREADISLLEIGVFDGASLRTWADFFPRAAITGIDVIESARVHESERITIRIGSQADVDFLQSLANEHGPFDVVIDDGSHSPADQWVSITALWPFVKPGGIYAVEDVHTSYFARWDGGYLKPGSFIEQTKRVVDDVNCWWHQREPLLAGVGSIHLYTDLFIFVREASPYRGGAPLDPERARELNTPRSKDRAGDGYACEG